MIAVTLPNFLAHSSYGRCPWRYLAFGVVRRAESEDTGSGIGGATRQAVAGMVVIKNMFAKFVVREHFHVMRTAPVATAELELVP